MTHSLLSLKRTCRLGEDLVIRGVNPGVALTGWLGVGVGGRRGWRYTLKASTQNTGKGRDTLTLNGRDPATPATPSESGTETSSSPNQTPTFDRPNTLRTR